MRDWLNAGETMMLEHADPAALGVFGRLFRSETEDSMDAAISELAQLGEAREAEFMKAEAEALQKAGVSRVTAQSDLDAALAEVMSWSTPAEPEQDPDSADGET